MNKLQIGLIITAAVLFRLVPHTPNLVPIGAIALFAGYAVKSKWSFLIPVLVMIISDYFVGFHNTMWFVYGSYVAITVMGRACAKHVTLPRITLLSLTGSALFYLVTNFGVWLMGTMYTKDLSGLIQSYLYAIPFFRATLIGDMIFNGVLYVLYSQIPLKSFLMRIIVAKK